MRSPCCGSDSRCAIQSGPEDLWTLARCGVEVPAVIARRGVPSLRVGAPVLAWGQLSDREADEDGTQRGVIVAPAVHSGARASLAASRPSGRRARCAALASPKSLVRTRPLLNNTSYLLDFS